MKKEYTNKLNQLDRIEYMLKEKEIDYSSNISSFIRLLISLMAFFMIFDIFVNIVYNISSNLFITVLSSGLFQITLYAYIILEIVSLLIWRYQQKKLDKEFFDFSFEIKPKEVKRNGSKSNR